MKNLKISGKTGQVVGRNVILINFKLPEKHTVEAKHTVLILDCSTSMTDSIDQVREDAKKYVAGLDKKHYVSVIIFSGHGTSRLIAGLTQCNEFGKKFLAQAISKIRVISNTVFSEALELTLEGVRTAAEEVATETYVTLFTDGCPVPSRWNLATEENKAATIAKALGDSEVFFSVIGYGPYYNQRFIEKLMDSSGNNGVFYHITEIEDFGKTIAEIQEIAEATSPHRLNLELTPSQGTITSVLKTTPDLAKVSDSGRINILGIYKNELTLLVENSQPCHTFYIKGGIDAVNIAQELLPQKLSSENELEAIRILGAYAFLSGDHATAAQLLSAIGEEGLAERAAEAWTDLEAKETGYQFRGAFRDRKFIGAGLKPTGPSHCLLNVLRVLVEDERNKVYVPAGAYKRIGLMTRDLNVIESPLGKTLEVVRITGNDTRFNFSLLCLKEIDVNLPEGIVSRKVWRYYTIIRDGNLNLPELKARLSEDGFEILQTAKVIGTNEVYSATRTYDLNFKNIKMVSSAWANPIDLRLVPLLQEEKELEAQQTALNARVKSFGRELAEDSLIYREKAEVVDGVTVDTYEAPCVEIRLMGYKAAGDLLHISNMGYEEAVARVKEVRQRLNAVRFIIRCIVFAMEATKSRAIRWDSGTTTKKGKHPKLEQNATFLGANLKKVSWKETVECS